MGGCGIGRFDLRSPVFSSQWMDVRTSLCVPLAVRQRDALFLAAALFCDISFPSYDRKNTLWRCALVCERATRPRWELHIHMQALVERVKVAEAGGTPIARQCG